MRKWGIIVSLVYAAILIAFLGPVFMVLADDNEMLSSDFLRHLIPIYQAWEFWIIVVALLLSQIVLLFLSVDISHRRLKPRTHIAVTCVAAALLTAILTLSAMLSLLVAPKDSTLLDKILTTETEAYCVLGVLWLLWTIVFYLFLRNSSGAVSKAVSWLLKGSILELLIAIPCHVIVRRRDECCAPMATGFGISTGVAIMLISFGPGVLMLYRKRLDAYSSRTTK